MSFDQGYDFRATLAGPSGFTSDPSGCVAIVSTTANYSAGQGYGFNSQSGLSYRDRDGTHDPRIAGMMFLTNGSGVTTTFRVDVPSSGVQYDITVALHDQSSGGSNDFLEVLDSDGTTVLWSVGPTTPSPTDNVLDANGSQSTAANWPTSNTTKAATPTGTSLFFRVGKTATAGTTTLSHLRVTQHVSGGLAASPSTIPASHAGAIAIALTGTATSWTAGTPGSPTFTVTNSVTGTTTATINSQSVASGTTATLNLHTGAGTGTFTISDGTFSATVTVATASFTLSPATGAINTSQTVTATGTNTVWTQETAATLFSVSGGTGPSISSIVVVSDTSAHFTLANGSSVATLTITANPTGATQTFVTTPVKSVIVFLGDSLTYGTDSGATLPDSSPVMAGTATYPGQVMARLGTSGWNGYNHGYSGKTISQIAAQYVTDNVVSHKNAAASYNIICLLAGTNDNPLNGTTVGPAMLSALQSLWTTLKGDGWLVVAVAIPPYRGTYGAQFDTSRGTVNAWLASNWRSYGLSAFAAATSATGGDARIGTLASATDATYYDQGDVPHMTASGYEALATSVAQAVFEAQNPGGTSSVFNPIGCGFIRGV